MRGEGRGSYIFGKSVHNICIEHLWINVTQGFGKHWKEFLWSLEVSCNLDPEINAHIWLIHHLFLDDINHDATTWADVWNNHTLSHHSETHRSPRFKYTHGVFENVDEGFSIDWTDIDNPSIRQHHDTHSSPEPHIDPNPFVASTPEEMTHVHIPDICCPFTDEQIMELDTHLAELPCRHEKNMMARKELWINLLSISQMIWQDSQQQLDMTH
ncbi:hypothetical protein ARMSODRAFT_987664 [Armillaria solidipes]|uniref:Integrase core domain-containing protein n=1 Tax=Armillaria solidipes TaxID=1076256 RepID=A0A2H3BJW8_9AGAR|nr:hypothetical protein ARMSODRAFT_987664 [Armillaria solidipes]